MNRLKSIVIAACAAMIAVGAFLPAMPAAAASSAALSIVPMKNYTIEAGKGVKDTLLIRNLDPESPLNLSLRVIDFTYSDDSGAPKLMLDRNAPQTAWSLKPYLSLSTTEVTVEPNSSQTIDTSIAIPENVGGCDFYSAIMYSSGEATDGGNVGLSASGVTLAFTTVPGDCKEKLTLEQFGAYRSSDGKKDAGYASVMTDMPQMIAYTLKNEGNVTGSPSGSITLKSMFGKEITINDVNPNGSLALIGQTRTFTSCIRLQEQNVDFSGSRSEAKTCDSPGLWPGMYTANLDLMYGRNGNITQEIHGSTVFWYLPWWFIMVVTAVLAIVSYFIWRIVRVIRQKFGHSVKLNKK